MKSTSAFTLIELLIVVAVISVLASIALPNFLEAQTRTKVARAKSDMRTLVVGLESYAVDNNVYPYTETIGVTPWLPPGGTPLGNTLERPGGLTSPIAYLATLPMDAFAHHIGSGITINAPVYYEKTGFGYLNSIRTTMLVAVPADSLGVNQKLDGIGPDVMTINQSDLPTAWVLYSVGPDLLHELYNTDGSIFSFSRYNLNNRYDPTNGTVSAGNILMYPGGMSYP